MEGIFLGCPNIRSKTAAHGQGPKPMPMPSYRAQLAVNLAASVIVGRLAAHDAGASCNAGPRPRTTGSRSRILAWSSGRPGVGASGFDSGMAEQLGDEDQVGWTWGRCATRHPRGRRRAALTLRGRIPWVSADGGRPARGPRRARRSGGPARPGATAHAPTRSPKSRPSRACLPGGSSPRPLARSKIADSLARRSAKKARASAASSAWRAQLAGLRSIRRRPPGRRAGDPCQARPAPAGASISGTRISAAFDGHHLVF